ncbi:Calx-beta domain-containing protein [Microcystis ichthyoblabe FBCC-A1114]|uniref:Calx-beta domain-containing protein n=1 Tax=Microcystis ichthyoblabe TaxID=75561 RepID=UPI003D2B8D03
MPPVDPRRIVPQSETLNQLPLPSLDLTKTFFLNSLPGANHTIYLDFNGHTTTGTTWNTAFGKSSIVTPAFDLDGNTAAFSTSELERIQYIWQRVVEDFSPFNVNVTTQEPTLDRLIKSSTTDTAWGVRVAIGGSSFDWLGAGAGGVAYVGSFNWNSDTPTFVFSTQTLSDEKYTADAISHEVGHTLGLNHDGRTIPSEEYYDGHGSGETGWGPIMGSGYYQNLTQWSKGEYLAANNTEDDLAIITTQNGFGYRVDDTGNTLATDKALTVSGTAVSANGIIERNTDVDFFSFTTAAGPISLTVTPSGRSPNLDILAELYNSAGVLVASSNPADFLAASISATVGAGTYYLKVDGVGKGDPLGTGYTDYGSLGQYAITGSIISGTKSISIAKTTDGKEAGPVSSVFTLTRTGDLSSALTVNYTLAGTATPGVDYTGTTPNTVTFAALSPTATITLPTIDDSVVDPSETIITKITAPTGYTISGSDTATATIVDNDGGGGNIFSNPNPISIDDESSGGTNPYPSTISVSGLSGNINNLKVTINDVSHTWIGDVDLLLVGPTGAKSILMSDIGEALSVSGVNLTFDTSATTLIDDSNVGTSGSYKPNDIDGGDGDFFDSPAPVGPYKADLSVFNNTSGNGTWSLYAFDDYQFLDVGSIAGGWSLTIGTAAPTKSISIAKTTDGNEAGSVGSVFTLTRTGDLSSALTVNYTLAGTATPGVDYTGTTPNTVTFLALSPTATITLPTKDDLLSDPSETIITKITAPAGYTISGPDNATATILDNDGNAANDNLVGTSLADALAGVGGNDTLDGGAGNDTLDGGADNDTYLFDTDLVLGSDRLIDASGIDTLNFAATTTKTINLNLGSTAAQTVTAGNLTLTLASATAFENVIGGSLNDNIVGNTLNNSLTGGLGKDSLTGSTGLDTLNYNSLGESLLSGFDVIQGYSGTGASLDRINAPAPIAPITLTASKGTATALTEAAIQLVLTNAAFAANTAAAFKVTGQSGTFIALNNGAAGFQAASDAIIQLSGYNIAAATPVVVI